MIAEIAREAIRGANVGGELLGYVRNEDARDYSVARALVQHGAIAAVGFTGSIPGGLAIERLAREREVPIPVFAEMGSTNPVLMTPGAVAHAGADIGRRVADSILARVGQQCTRPGMVFVPNLLRTGLPVLDAMRERFVAVGGRDMLTSDIWSRFADREHRTSRTAGVSSVSVEGPVCLNSRHAKPALWTTTLEIFRTSAELHDEIFGPAAVLIDIPSVEALSSLRLRGSLTCSIWHTQDAAEQPTVEALARYAGTFAGRIIFNGVPTGVRVAHGMVHGGPFPATNRPDTTAVGPFAIERWCRPVCFQNCPDGLLPAELRNGNPRGIWRTLNGTRCKASVA
jgi:NADP-dependent aldehyde dehydrogenase